MSRFDYADGRRRPPQDTRALLNGVLWILRTSVQWRELPPKYLPYQTCHRRFSVMAPDGLLRDVLPRPGPCRSGETKDIRVAHYQASLSSSLTGFTASTSPTGLGDVLVLSALPRAAAHARQKVSIRFDEPALSSARRVQSVS